MKMMIKFSRESRLFQSLRIKIILFKKKIQIPRFESLPLVPRIALEMKRLFFTLITRQRNSQ